MCPAVHVLKGCAANTMCPAVHVLKGCAANTMCPAVHVLKGCAANTMCSEVNRTEFSLSTSSINIYSSNQTNFTTAIHSPPPPLPSALFYSVTLTTYPYVKNPRPDFSILQS